MIGAKINSKPILISSARCVTPNGKVCTHKYNAPKYTSGKMMDIRIYRGMGRTSHNDQAAKNAAAEISQAGISKLSIKPPAFCWLAQSVHALIDPQRQEENINDPLQPIRVACVSR